MKTCDCPRPNRMCARLLCILAAIVICTARVDAWHPNPQRPDVQEHIASVPFADSGTLVDIPEVAAFRLGLGQIESVQPLSMQTQRRIVATMNSMLPCWERYVDNVFVIRHPESTDQPRSGVRDHLMAATVTVDVQDPVTHLLHAAPALNLYLYLPDDLLDGSELDTVQTTTNIVPYAAAPVPLTLGEILDWTLYHEIWHLLDLHARLDQVAADPSGRPLQDVMNDPEVWKIAFPELTVGRQRGWQDTGERYLLSDELEGDRMIRAGDTSYQLYLGSILADYDDGTYAFRRSLQRSGYLPLELVNLSDLKPLLRSGMIPTLYALFNTSAERLAEYGAWFVFAQQKGHEQTYEALFPELDRAYEGRLRAARRRCRLGIVASNRSLLHRYVRGYSRASVTARLDNLIPPHYQ